MFYASRIFEEGDTCISMGVEEAESGEVMLRSSPLGASLPCNRGTCAALSWRLSSRTGSVEPSFLEAGLFD